MPQKTVFILKQDPVWLVGHTDFRDQCVNVQMISTRLPLTSACDNYLWQIAYDIRLWQLPVTTGIMVRAKVQTDLWAGLGSRNSQARTAGSFCACPQPMRDCNVISHWLGTYTEWSLNRHPIWCELGLNMILLIHFRSSKTTDIESVLSIMDPEPVNSSFPWPNGRHFAENIFRCIFANEKFCILIKFSLKFVPKGQIDNNSALV